MDRGVNRPVRETFHSSLRLSEMALEELGVAPDEARQAMAFFRDHDEKSLRETHAFYEDERRLIQNAKQAAEELSGLFEADQRERRPEPARSRKAASG